MVNRFAEAFCVSHYRMQIAETSIIFLIRVPVFNIVVLTLGALHRASALIDQYNQQASYGTFTTKRIKFAHENSSSDSDASSDDDSPLEKIWHHDVEPKLFDRFHFFDDKPRANQASVEEQNIISKKERELERLACLQRLSKCVHKQKKLAQQVVAIKTPKNQIKRAAHYQYQPIRRCQKK